MSEPVLVIVILKTVPNNYSSGTMAQAFAMLLEWADAHDVNVQTPVDRDAETLRFAVVLASDEEQADLLIAELQSKAFVDTSYRKPADALP